MRIVINRLHLFPARTRRVYDTFTATPRQGPGLWGASEATGCSITPFLSDTLLVTKLRKYKMKIKCKLLIIHGRNA